MDSLQKIIDWKKEEITKIQPARGVDATLEIGRDYGLHDLESALQEPGMQVIAEVKRKSPSEGNISKDFDIVSIATQYELAGAAAISVLTDKKFFGGSIDDLKAVKDAVDIPVLRKDFIIDESQVEEAYLNGADAILLIADVLSVEKLSDLHAHCEALGMGALVEVHDLSNLTKLANIEPEIVGFNARNLKSMQTDIRDFESVISKLPRAARVAESGIKNADDLSWVASLGYDAALIGTSLLRASSPAGLLAEMLEEARDR